MPSAVPPSEGTTDNMAATTATDWPGFGYAALVVAGGLLGYVKAGSVPSLAAGLLFGGAAGVGAYQITQNPKNVWLSLAF
ncbi:transmembrane protein 14C-like isoform X2 [Rhinoraja longicauda]